MEITVKGHCVPGIKIHHSLEQRAMILVEYEYSCLSLLSFLKNSVLYVSEEQEKFLSLFGFFPQEPLVYIFFSNISFFDSLTFKPKSLLFLIQLHWFYFG
jgi:hypothetical protein